MSHEVKEVWGKSYRLRRHQKRCPRRILWKWRSNGTKAHVMSREVVESRRRPRTFLKYLSNGYKGKM